MRHNRRVETLFLTPERGKGHFPTGSIPFLSLLSCTLSDFQLSADSDFNLFKIPDFCHIL